MIRPAQVGDFERLSSSDPFCTRVLSLYQSYGTEYGFAAFWAQEADGAAVTLISRFEDKFSLYLTDSSDVEEIAAFLSFQGAGAVTAARRFSLGIDARHAVSGQVLRYTGEHYISDIEIYEPDFRSVYELLLSCAGESFIVPDRMMFLSDVTHRRNLGKCAVLGAAVGGVLASSVMTVSETEYAAIIGAVATHPDYRRIGLSRELVRTLASRINEQGREAYVFSASGENTRFYQNSGFEIVTDFCEIFL